MTGKKRTWLVLLLITLIVVGITMWYSRGIQPPKDPTLSIGQSIQVQINVFSGRENPGWVTNSTELNDFGLSIFNDLPKSDQITAPKSGYRGFILILPSQTEKESTWIYLYNGVMYYQTSSGTADYRKDTIGLEELLKKEAVKKGYQHFLSL